MVLIGEVTTTVKVARVLGLGGIRGGWDERGSSRREDARDGCDGACRVTLRSLPVTAVRAAVQAVEQAIGKVEMYLVAQPPSERMPKQ